MKKIFTVFFVSFVCLFLFSGIASAYGPGCSANNNTTDPAAWNSTNKPVGLVPCGISKYPTPLPAGSPDGAVAGAIKCPCELGHLFIMFSRVYTFVLWDIGTPLAGLLVVAGGVLLLISGGDPKRIDLGKRLLWGAFWGIILMFGSWLIIDIVLKAIGYTGVWNAF